jgi:hypothetical protein
MSRQGDGDCTCGEFDWVKQLSLDQLELLEWLLRSGLRDQLGTERWERGWKLVDAIACHKEKIGGARRE